MDNLRLILVIAFLFLSYVTYVQWQKDYGPRPAVSAAAQPSGGLAQPAPEQNEIPQPSSAEAGPGQPPPEGTERGAGRIEVRTDVLRVELDTLGGDIRRVELPTYPVSVEQADTPFRLMDDQLPQLFIAQSGLLAGERGATHQTTYRSEQTRYQLADGQEQLEVKLSWDGPDGTQITKLYTFRRGAYTVGVRYLVSAGNTPWEGHLYGQLQRAEGSGPQQSSFVYTFTGAAFASPHSRYQKIGFDEIRKAGAEARLGQDGTLTRETQAGWDNGWIAMLQHYFVAALVPDPQQTYTYYTKYLENGQRYVLGLYSPALQIAAGQQQAFDFQLYAGPKLQHRLEELAPGLDLTVDYGWLWFLSKPIFWLMEKLHLLIGNWGWTIVVLTILIKLAFFHLSATSYKSMAQMRKVQPRLMALKERYADDRAGLNQAMMDMYRKEKINPLGGCLPIVVQIPVFIALYWVLLESVELRQADFIFWINDLSTADPYFVLPLIMGVTMFVQQYLNPAPMDPVQQKVMMFLPVIFTVFFAFFPAGLVLYWLVNNVLSIAQQWYITKQIAGETLLGGK